MVALLLGNESSDLNRFILVTPKSENDVRLQATLDNQNPTGLPVGAVSLNHIDMMDALMYQYEKRESATEPGTLTDSPMVVGQWTSYNPRGQNTHVPEV